MEPIRISNADSAFLDWSIEIEIVIPLSGAATERGWVHLLERVKVHRTDPRPRVVLSGNDVAQIHVQTAIVKRHTMQCVRWMIASVEVVQVHGVTRIATEGGEGERM